VIKLRTAVHEWDPKNPPSVRARLAYQRNILHLRSEKLQSLLFSRTPRKILFSEMPDWEPDIRSGFRRLPHHVDFGPITEQSLQTYDIVVPLTLAALADARRHLHRQKNPLPIPSPESVRLCDDKFTFNQVLIKAGFGRYIPNIAQGQALKPPFILKKRIDWWGKNCHIIRNNDDEIEQIDRINDPEYFCQELIPGPTEFATHILFINGRIVKALNIMYEFDRPLPIKGQDRTLFQVVHRCPYLGLFARILQTIKFEGLCCVNYKVADRQPYLLEINPRFGGSLAPYFFSFVRFLR
jgi:predicted ATP-grasp superfamily ATP-dependent carboligase